MTDEKKTTLLLIRHGLTDWNVARRWQGHADIPLNQTGQQQAEALARRLADWPLEVIISSDLERCRATATALAAPHQLTPILDPIWRERDVGAFSGLTGPQSREQFPHIWKGANRGMVDPPDGERFVDVRVRALSAYNKVVAEHTGRTVVVVSHGGLLHMLIAQLIGVDNQVYGRFSMRGNTGLSIVEVNDRGPIVTRLNDTSHLEN